MNILKQRLLNKIVDNKVLLAMLRVYGQIKNVLISGIPGKVTYVSLNTVRVKMCDAISWIRVTSTPHYRSLMWDSDPKFNPFSKYCEDKGVRVGYPAHTSLEHLNHLSNMQYLDEKSHFENYHIMVVKAGSKYYVLDGVHRCSILAFQNKVGMCVKVVHPMWILPFFGRRTFHRIKVINREYFIKKAYRKSVDTKYDTLYD